MFFPCNDINIIPDRCWWGASSELHHRGKVVMTVHKNALIDILQPHTHLIALVFNGLQVQLVWLTLFIHFSYSFFSHLCSANHSDLSHLSSSLIQICSHIYTTRSSPDTRLRTRCAHVWTWAYLYCLTWFCLPLSVCHLFCVFWCWTSDLLLKFTSPLDSATHLSIT